MLIDFKFKHMKKYVFLLSFLVFVVSCNDNEKRSNSENPISEESNSDRNTDEDNYADLDRENPENNNIDSEGANTDENKSANGFVGLYKKVDPEAKSGNCDCYCMDLVFGSNFEVCLVPGKIDIDVISKKTGNNTADLFLVAPINSQIPEGEIPWETFSRDLPIAKLEHLPDGSLKLDWIGFSVDGELAVDYAIFGKKTLEGTYKK